MYIFKHNREANMGHSIEQQQADLELTRHSERRMSQRGIGETDILMVLQYGRLLHSRGACIHVVGRKEIKEARKDKVYLEDIEGIHVISSNDGAVLTVYRNKKLNLKNGRNQRLH
jgi:hypothetical protein